MNILKRLCFTSVLNLVVTMIIVKNEDCDSEDQLIQALSGKIQAGFTARAPGIFEYG